MHSQLAKKLQEYLDNTGTKKKHLVEKIGCNPNTISNILKGKPTTLEVALKLQKETNGYVSIEDAGYKREDYGL